MITKYVRYKVRPDEVTAVRGAIEALVAGIGREEPGTASYEAFQELEDETRFVHLMRFVDADAEAFHRATPHVQSFVEDVYPRCEEPPAFTDVVPVAGVRR